MIKEEKKVSEDVAVEPVALNVSTSLHLLAKDNTTEQRQQQRPNGIHHHQGLIKAMLARSVGARFSSKPIDLEQQQHQQKEQQQQNRFSTPPLTLGEQEYLTSLLQTEDPDSIRQASLTLSDRYLFPTREDSMLEFDEDVGNMTEEEQKDHQKQQRRDSEVQQLMYRLHEMARGSPSRSKRSKGTNSTNSSPSTTPTRPRLTWQERKDAIIQACVGNNNTKGATTVPSKDLVEESQPTERVSHQFDIASWLDGNQGIEVNDDGTPDNTKQTVISAFQTSFSILGTVADDSSCHPHVLSPPLMESLLEFVPESLSDCNFWIKYSLIRDGFPSSSSNKDCSNLWTLLKHARGSSRTVLAIETTEGDVLGAFTSSPWRLVSPHQYQQDDQQQQTKSQDLTFFGHKESFLWKMRNGRFDLNRSSLEQAVLMESELVVFPFTNRNNYVQCCTMENGLGLGEASSALRLDPSLRSGTTGASDTFGNPCLLDAKEAYKDFTVANLELWTLTPHDNVKAAERDELNTLFLEGQRHEHEKRLDLLGILVGN